MAVDLSPIGGAGAQFFDNNGIPLSGGKLYTYAAATTTPKASFTSAAGIVPHTNPIILDSAGRVPGGEIWLTSGEAYKFVLETPTSILLGTWDNIYGYTSGSADASFEVQTATAGQTLFVLTTMAYVPGTNTLGVYIDGVNQVVNNSYIETNGTSVTFVSGLHAGAIVKFVNVNIASTTANVVTYAPGFTGSVATTVEDKLRQYVSVKDFGAIGDGVADDTAAIQAAASAASNNILYFPAGTYLCNSVIGAIGSMEGEGFISTKIQYSGTAAHFINFTGRFISGIAFEALNSGYAAEFTKTSAAFQSFNNCRWIGVFPAPAGGCLLATNSAINIEINGCSFEGLDVNILGQKSDGTGFCNGLTLSNTLFNVYSTAAIKNPGQGWNLEQCLFEPTPASGVANPKSVLAIDCDPAVKSLGLNITGCWFGDNIGPNAVSFIKFIGDGLSLTGSYINGNGFNNCNVIEVMDTSSGIFVAGNFMTNFASVIKTNNFATNISLGANRLRFVLADIVGTFTNDVLATGVKFPAVQVPSADANTLDDYEEGVFSPDIYFGDSQVGSFTLDKNLGYYVKVGRLVTVSMFIKWSAKPTGGQFLRVKLPFVGIATDGTYGISGLAITSHEGTFNDPLGGATLLANTADAQIYSNIAATSVSYTHTQIPAAGALNISGTYITAA